MLVLISLILLKLLDISNLFNEISALCSAVVCKYVVFKVVTVSLRVSTSVNKSEFTIVAEPYRPVELILIIYIIIVYIIFLSKTPN